MAKDHKMKYKVHTADIADGLTFTLSDESVDRMGDVIRVSGWQLDSFKRNPIALFSHQSTFPIGKWSDLRVVKSELRGKLELAPKGTSQRIDELRGLVEAGILKAVSVGFREIDSKPRESGGVEFLKQELVETSLVAIPANENALSVAKSLNISEQTRNLVFAKHGIKDKPVQRRPTTKPASSLHDGWWTREFYDLAYNHLVMMAERHPYNEMWAKWRDEMQRKQLDFLRK
jgi:HK97 family phage prohead protease